MLPSSSGRGKGTALGGPMTCRSVESVGDLECAFAGDAKAQALRRDYSREGSL